MWIVSYIKEDCVSVGVTIVPVNTIESLRKLNVADLLSNLRIHQKAHCFPHGLAVIHVVITVQVQHEWSICEYTCYSNLAEVSRRKKKLSHVRPKTQDKFGPRQFKKKYQGVHGTSFLVVLKTRPLLT